VHILYLHHVLEDEEPGFRLLLEYLAREHVFVSFGEAVDRIRAGQFDRPYVAFSFDDGFNSCLGAADLLEEFGAQACFFVCPAFLEETDPEKVAIRCREIFNLPPMKFLSWQDVEKLRARGHEIGSHTIDHCRATGTEITEWREQLVRSREALERRVGRIDHFAWPYGLFSDITPAATEAVFDAGYLSCSSAIRGCHVAPADDEPSRLCLRRDHLVAAWPLTHALYLLARSADLATEDSNLWPQDWTQ
jgi:peptidoglycan/xylan/chitin deacetylase (PgdA/CDA1 family)